MLDNDDLDVVIYPVQNNPPPYIGDWSANFGAWQLTASSSRYCQGSAAGGLCSRNVMHDLFTTSECLSKPTLRWSSSSKHIICFQRLHPRKLRSVKSHEALVKPAPSDPHGPARMMQSPQGQRMLCSLIGCAVQCATRIWRPRQAHQLLLCPWVRLKRPCMPSIWSADSDKHTHAAACGSLVMFTRLPAHDATKKDKTECTGPELSCQVVSMGSTQLL